MCVRIALTAALVVSLLGSSSSQNEQKSKYVRVAYVPGGFLRARDFLELPQEMKEGYAMGLLNGIFASTLLGTDEGIARAFSDCVKDMDSHQVAAIIKKYVKDHPENWHDGLNMESANAMISTCPQVPALLKKQ